MSAMYLINKYTKWYNLIIERAKNRTVTGYSEKHHILPKSLGGDNSDTNLVELTAREHFICHLLLTKMLLDDINRKKMIHASWAMSNLRNEFQDRFYQINSRIYESLREQYADLVRERLIGKPGKRHSKETREKLSLSAKNRPRRGPMSDESKKKLSESMKGKNVGKHRTHEQRKTQSERQKGKTGKKHSEEAKQKIRESLNGMGLGRKTSIETKRKQSEAHKGKIRSKEHSNKLSLALKNRKPSHQERIAYLNAMEAGKTTCEHCNKTTTKGNYYRWHGEQCRFINISNKDK